MLSKKKKKLKNCSKKSCFYLKLVFFIILSPELYFNPSSISWIIFDSRNFDDNLAILVVQPNIMCNINMHTNTFLTTQFVTRNCCSQRLFRLPTRKILKMKQWKRTSFSAFLLRRSSAVLWSVISILGLSMLENTTKMHDYA